jgi:hypothetical protein
VWSFSFNEVNRIKGDKVMEWQEFLKQQAMRRKLSSIQIETLLAAFPDVDKERPQTEIVQELAKKGTIIQEGSLKSPSRLGGIYKNFEEVEPVCPELAQKNGAGKLEALYIYLKQIYINEQKPPIVDKLDYPKDYPKEFRELIDSRTKRFVGRKFVFDAFEEFIQENDRGYFTVIGEPGMGKSAIAANYVVTHKAPCYFNVITDGNNTPDVFLESIRSQLIKRYNLENLQTANLLTLLEEVRDRLRDSLRDEQRLIIVVDALDEVNQLSNVENILNLPKFLPKNVYFLLTRRPFKESEKRLFTELSTPQKKLDLRNMEQLNQNDIKACIRLFLNEDRDYKDKLQNWLNQRNYQPEAFIELVASKVIDNFMYLVCLMDALVKKEYEDFDLNQLPPNLEEYYDLHWRRMGMNQPENRLKTMIIYTIKEIQTPIPKEAVAAILETAIEDVESVLNNWFQYFKVKAIDGEVCYDLYHLTFKEYLASREELKSDKPIFQEVNQKIYEFLKKHKP